MSIEIPSIGTLYYEKYSDHPVWSGLVDTISPNNKIELSIEPWNGTELPEDQIKLIQQLPGEFSFYTELLYVYMADVYEELSLKDIKQMYFLVGIVMKKYNNAWWFTFEPHYNNPSLYYHFQRFTIVNKVVTWSNIK